MDYAEKSRKFQKYMDGLEEERRKIQMFQRELPLCLELVTQAIDSCRQKLVASELHLGRSDCEETSSEGPVLEEFMPLKRSSSEEEEQYELESKERQENTGKKPDWLRLGNRDPDPPSKEDLPRKPLAVVTKNGGGAFQPFYKEKRAPTPSTAIAAASSSAETGGREEKEGQGLSNRKTRRCWSPELHRRFLHALQQLGGSHAATPKQIRELMKVDGLTNDEVKSHLQKYRLHTRRPSPPGAMQSSSSNNNGQGPQFVVVGGIWVPPPPEYTVAVTGQRAEGASNRIYAPIAAAPLQPFVGCEKQQAQPSLKRPLYSSEGRSSREERSLGADDNANSNSPASSSSSSHATTGSPAF